MNRFGSPSRTMEESLDEVLSAADLNLATLERKKRAVQGAPPITRSQYIEAKRLLTPELYQTATRARPASAPRGATTTESLRRSVAFEDEGNFEQKSEESIDRRFDAFLRKQRLMEDRLKKLESQKSTDAQAAQELHEANNKLLDEQKNDHKLIHNLKSQLSSLKTKVDLLVSNEEQREVRDARNAEHNLRTAHFPSHSNAHTNYTTSVNNADLSAQIAEAVRAQISTLNPNLTTTNTAINTTLNSHNTTVHTGLNTTQNSIFARSNNESIHSLEKECIRLSAEFDRTKTRLSVLDSAYNELKVTVSIREARAEEAHKRAVNQHRVEVETFLSSAARKTADALTSIHANTIDITALRSDLDSFIDRTGSVLAELDTKLTQHDSSIEEIYSVLERVEHGLHTIKHTTQDHDNNILRFVEDSVTLAKVSSAVEQHSRTLQLHNERIEHVNMVCDTNTSAIDAHTVPIDILAKSIDSINDKFEARTDTLHSTITSNHTTLNNNITELHNTHKRTRAKVRDLTESLKGISTIRQSIDSVLQEVDSRAKQDASWTYSFKAALQRVESRVLSVERALNPTGALLASDADDTGSVNTADSGGHQAGSPSKQTLPLHTTQFDQLRSLITSLRAELTHTHSAQSEALRESVHTVLEERLEALVQRCQEQIEETRAHCENYTEEQLQASLDDLHSTLETVHNSVADLHVLFDGLSGDVDSLGGSLRAEINGLDGDFQPLREQVLVLENRVDVAFGDVRAVQEQVNSVSELGSRVDKLEVLCNSDSGEDVTLTTLSDQQSTLAQELHALQAQHAANHSSTSSAINNLDNQCSDLAERLEQCNTIVYGQESLINECNDTLQNELSSVQDSVLDVLSQLGEVREGTRAQIKDINEEISTLKEDLSTHISFTNNCLADQQTMCEERAEEQKSEVSQQLEEVKQSVQGMIDGVQSTLESRLDGVVDLFTQQLEEVKEEVQQNDTTIHTEVASMSALHATEHSTTTAALAGLHATLSAQEASSKGRLSSVEKRLAGQEGVIRERVVALEVKLSTLDDSLRSHIAAMQGTLHSQTLQIQTQSEQLQQSVPLDTMRAQDTQLATALTSLIVESCDALKSQIIVLRERADEAENRISTTDAELSSVVDSIAAQYNTFNTTLHAYIDTAIATTTNTNTTALVTLTNDILSTVDDRNNSMRELVYQLHEIVGTQQDEHAHSVSAIDAVTAQVAELRNSILSTDALLSEHVNESTARHAALAEEVNAKCSSDEVPTLVAPLILPLVTPLLAQLQDTVTADCTTSIDVLTNTLHQRCDDVQRRCVHVEQASSTSTDSVKAQITDLTNKHDVFESNTTHQLSVLTTTLSTVEAAHTSTVNTLHALSTEHSALLSEVRTNNTTLSAKLSDNSQLIQLNEKRLRTAEKSIESRYSDLSKANSDLHTQLTARINSVSSGVEQCNADNKQCVNSLTLQLLSIQAQLNEHSEEVRTLIDTELLHLRENVDATLTSHASTSGSTRVQEWITSGSTRLEEWLQTLQAAHEDHLGQFDTTVHALDQRVGAVESSVDSLHANVNTLHNSVESASSAHNSTLLELHNELHEQNNSTKARIGSVEQRLIRSESSNKEKYSELESRISENIATTHTITHSTLPGLHTHLAAHDTTLAHLQSSSSGVSAVQQRMQDIEERIHAHSVDSADKIGRIEAYILEQVKAVQSRTIPGANSSTVAVTDTKTKAEEPSAEAAADLSHISRVTISPVRRTSSGTARGDLLDQRVRLTTHDDSALFADAGLTDPHQVDLNLGYESELFDEGEGSERGGARGGHSASGDEHDDDDAVETGESLQQFHSMIETVNFDIATLGTHLKSFQPDQDTLSRRAAQQLQTEQDEERRELERQAAVENLQLKKFNHRRKFQRVLFEKQG